MSIEPPPPKAYFWHSATLQPWSVSPVAEMRQGSGLVTNPAMQAFNLNEWDKLLPARDSRLQAKT